MATGYASVSLIESRPCTLSVIARSECCHGIMASAIPRKCNRERLQSDPGDSAVKSFGPQKRKTTWLRDSIRIVSVRLDISPEFFNTIAAKSTCRNLKQQTAMGAATSHYQRVLENVNNRIFVFFSNLIHPLPSSGRIFLCGTPT